MAGCVQPIPVPLCCSFLCTPFPCFSVVLLHGLQSFRKQSSTPAWSPQCATVWISALVWSSPEVAEKYLLHHGICSVDTHYGTWSTSSLSFFSDLGVCKILSHFSCYSLTQLLHSIFYRFLNILSEMSHLLFLTFPALPLLLWYFIIMFSPRHHHLG